MLKKEIWQLAAAGNNAVCPVCGKQLDQYRPCTVMVNSSNGKHCRPYTCNALYCQNCDIPFADASVGKAVFNDTGCRLRIFPVDKKASAASIWNQMFYHKKPPILKKKVEYPSGFERVARSAVSWKTAQKICYAPIDIQKCPNCNSTLCSDYTLLPLTDDQNAKICGMLCRRCRTIYVSENPELYKVMRDNPLSKGFTLNGQELWNASVVEKEQTLKEDRKQRWIERKRILQEIPSAVVMICTKSQEKTEEYIITTQNASSSCGNSFWYGSTEGRELLSAAFAEQREKKGILYGKHFKVISIVFAGDHAKSLPEHILPVQFTISRDGGYYSSVINRNYELVDLLVYSPFSQRYELMRSTYNKKGGYCYTDIGIFRSFVQKHGNPGIAIDFPRSFSGGFSYHDFRSESVLMGYGYSVSEANQISDRDRREILSEIVDLEILTVHQIVGMLDFFCNLHSGTRYTSARSKWMSDKQFIVNYKVNPNRFLIARTSTNAIKSNSKQEI